MSVQELENAVAALPPEDLSRFSLWFEEYLADQWDKRIEADAASGKFDAAGARAVADFDAGRCKPL